jgi:hypothetical protein
MLGFASESVCDASFGMGVTSDGACDSNGDDCAENFPVSYRLFEKIDVWYEIAHVLR